MYQLKGKQFGRLLVVDRAGSDKAKKRNVALPMRLWQRKSSVKP